MQKIKKPSMVYKTPQDVRRHSFGVAKYVYLSILAFFVFVILNYIFYPAYILNGDGFVLSERENIALEYDAKVKLILVGNGDRVEAGDSLFLHDSIDFKTGLIKSSTEYADTLIKFQSYVTELNKLRAQIRASKAYFDFVEKNKKKLDELYRGRITDIDRVLNETTRLYESNKDLMGLKAEFESANKAYDQLRQVVGLSGRALTDMIDEFNDGLVKTPVSGIVGGLRIAPGSIVKKGDTIIELFYGKRFISILFEESFVSFDLGDPVMVYIPGHRMTIGRIVDIGAYSARLPEEIKPKYRPPGRRRLATVLIEEGHLKDLDIMTVVEAYKPVGLEAYCKVFDCHPELIDEYREFVAEKRARQLETLRNYKPYRVKIGMQDIELQPELGDEEQARNQARDQAEAEVEAAQKAKEEAQLKEQAEAAKKAEAEEAAKEVFEKGDEKAAQ